MSDLINFIKNDPIMEAASVLAAILIIVLIFLIIKLVKESKKEKRIITNQQSNYPYRQPQNFANQASSNPQRNFQQNYVPGNTPNSNVPNNNIPNNNPVQNSYNPQMYSNQVNNSSESTIVNQQSNSAQYINKNIEYKIEQPSGKDSSQNITYEVTPELEGQTADPDETQALFTGSQTDAFETELLVNEVKAPLAKLEYDISGQIKEYAITSPSITIGRDAETCHLVVSFDTHIGRRHAMIQMRDKHFFIVDLNSRNGTFINGIKLTSEREIFSGDTIKLAATEFKFITFNMVKG